MWYNCSNNLFSKSFSNINKSTTINFSTSFTRQMAKLSGKVAIVTGSTKGIGFSIAKRLAEDGAKVMISSRKQDNVDSAVQELKSLMLDVSGLQCNVGTAEDRKLLVSETLKKYNKVDIFVSNVGVNPHFGRTIDCSEEAWDKIFNMNVKSGFLLCKEIIPLMQKNGSGSIVFVSSIAGFQPIRMIGPYSVSKTALLGLTKVLADEYATDNIRVNAIAPGLIKTPFSVVLTETDSISEHALSTIPMRRFGQPDEMGGIVSFMCSDDASYMTGEVVALTGGMNSRL